MKQKPGNLRIIGGHWRRRLISIPDIPGVRPTHDRIRETLFNWLMHYVEGASCLDLFAGSGALGFEALSRGAKQVTFVDQDPGVIKHLKQTAQALEIPPEYIEIKQGSCPNDPLLLSFAPYDIIFLDPPFQDKRFNEFLAWLESRECFTQSTLIYVEIEKPREPLQLPNWHCLKEKYTKNIAYYLFERE